MTTARTGIVSPSITAVISRWTGHGLELLWLLMVVFVPLAFLHRDYVLSEAVIAYVEVPKIALLRILAGLMAILWMIEWAVQGRFVTMPLTMGERYKLKPSVWLPQLRVWLRDRPARWLALAAWLYLFTTLLTTALSGSFTTSFWGEIPGQDSHATYTVLSYLILFAVISTHLKTKAQLWRLLGAVVTMGTLVAAYAIFQHYGRDFFELTEQTGGGLGRVTSFMGNTLFAAAVLCMTIPITLTLATISLKELVWTSSGLGRNVKKILLALVLTVGCSVVLAVQLLGITFTFSRGPWVGTIIGTIIFLILVGLFAGRGALVRATIIGGLTAVLAVAFLQWQDSISLLNQGRWFGAAIAIGGILGTSAVIVDWRRLGRVVVALAVLGAIVAGILVLPPLVKGNLTAGGPGPITPNMEGGSTSSLAAERFSSISTNVRSGIIGGRATHWKVSWLLIRDRPWFEFDDLNFRWLRPVIGYGPDLFRYTYLLKSPAEGAGLLPLEPDHAHNFFIHQTVEQGLLGLISSLGIFASLFLVSGYLLFWRRESLSPVHRLLLIGLLAMLGGRFVEMQFGLTKVSDSTVLWTLLAVFVVLPGVMRNSQEATIPPPNERRRNPRSGRAGRAAQSSHRNYDWRLVLRLALVAWIIGGVGMLMWIKGANYVRAAIVEAEGFRYFRNGDLQATLTALDRAIQLAPDVPVYYHNRAQVYLSYQVNESLGTEKGCSAQSDLPYKNCLALRALESNARGAQRSEFYYRSWLSLGNTASNLTQDEAAVRFYQRSLGLTPSSWTVANELADAQIKAGQPEAALKTLVKSMEITGGTEMSARGLFLQGLAYRDLGELNEAANSLERSLRLSKAISIARPSLELLSQIYSDLGVELSIPYFDEVVRRNPQDVFAFFNRGQAHNQLGRYTKAREDLDRTLSLGLRLPEVYAARGAAILGLGEPRVAQRDIDQAIADDPQNSKWYALRSLYNQQMRNYDAAIKDLDLALRLDPDLAEAFQYRGLLHHRQGEYQPALLEFDKAINLNPQLSAAFVDRGKTYLKLGRIDEALNDFDEALEINPKYSRILSYRAEGYLRKGDLGRAMEDAVAAILNSPELGEAFFVRGMILIEQGRLDEAIQDFDKAIEFAGGLTRSRFKQLIPAYAEAVLKITQDAGNHLFLGIAYIELQEYELALQHYEEANRLTSLGSEFHNRRGLALYGMGRYRQAVQAYDEAIGLKARDADYHMNRGSAHNALGQYKLAEQNYSTAIRLERQGAMAQLRSLAEDFSKEIAINGSRADLYNQRGLVYKSMGEFQLAIRDFEQTIELTPSDGTGYFNRGLAFYDLGQLQLADNDFEQAISLNPKNTGYYESLGLAYYELGRLDQALEFLDQAIQLKPDNTGTFYNRGRVYEGLGDYGLALKDYEAAIRGDRTNFLAFAGRGNSHGWLGDYDRAVRDYTAAIDLGLKQDRLMINLTLEASTKAVQQDPDDANAHLYLGVGYSRLGDFQRAVQHYSQVIRLVPDSQEIYNKRGFAFYKLGQIELAIQDFDAAIELLTPGRVNPGDNTVASVYNNRGLAYYSLGQSMPALRDFTRAIEIMKGWTYLDPKFAKQLSNRARVYVDLGRYQEAADDLDKAIAMVDRNRTMDAFLGQGAALGRQLAESYQVRGIAYSGLGQQRQAVADLSAAIRLDPILAEAYIARADAYEKLGESSLATQDSEKAASFK